VGATEENKKQNIILY